MIESKFNRVHPIQGDGYGLGGEATARIVVPLMLRDPGDDFVDGVEELNNDYSITPGKAAVTIPGIKSGFTVPATGETEDSYFYYAIKGFTIYYSASGTFNPDGFGAGVALPNGLKVKFLGKNLDGSPSVYEFFDGTSINTNGEWIKWFGAKSVRIGNWGGTTINYLSAFFDIGKIFGTNFIMNPGDSIQVDLEDDFSGLAEMHASITGRLLIELPSGKNWAPAFI